MTFYLALAENVPLGLHLDISSFEGHLIRKKSWINKQIQLPPPPLDSSL